MFTLSHLPNCTQKNECIPEFTQNKTLRNVVGQWKFRVGVICSSDPEEPVDFAKTK